MDQFQIEIHLDGKTVQAMTVEARTSEELWQLITEIADRLDERPGLRIRVKDSHGRIVVSVGVVSTNRLHRKGIADAGSGSDNG